MKITSLTNIGRKLHAYRRLLILSAVSLLGFISTASANTPTYYDLVFANPVPSTNGSDPDLGPYYSGLSYDFRNVSPTSGTNIDMRVTVSLNNPADYEYVGSFPEFNNGDLGVLYQYDGNRNVSGGGTVSMLGGLEYTLTFYQGGGTFTNEIDLSAVRLLIYDVDGDDAQSESIRAYNSDGLVGFQLPIIGGITQTYDPLTQSYKFTGPGVNRDERDESGAFILHYQNTSSIRLTMEANTLINKKTASTVNGAFSGIDGDLNCIDETKFHPIPEPSTAFMILASCGLLFIFRRRNG